MFPLCPNTYHAVDALQGSSNLEKRRILPIVTYPHPILRQRSAPVDTFDHQLTQLAHNMIATMEDAGGIGIAAVQVGVLLRMIVVDVNAHKESDLEETQEDPHHHQPDDDSRSELLVMVNPVLINLMQPEDTGCEGCLSIPGVTYDVTRPQTVVVSYDDLKGDSHTRSMDGLPARCVQHEIDHLNGVLFWDHCTRLRRQRLIKAYPQHNS